MSAVIYYVHGRNVGTPVEYTHLKRYSVVTKKDSIRAPKLPPLLTLATCQSCYFY
jgi:hypothetical protein